MGLDAEHGRLVSQHLNPNPPAKSVVVVGGGPAGLMAADVLSQSGVAVTILERMPTAGRKLLIAGRGGLNLTHSEPLDAFLGRYGPARRWLAPAIEAYPPAALIALAHDLGQETFVGTSGRVFPKAMKASPLLRAWLARLGARGVQLLTRHRWTGIDAGGAVAFVGPDGQEGRIAADAVVLALGGASWPRLGSDGGWVLVVADWGVGITPLEAANAGVQIAWSETLVARHAGTPLKRIGATCGDQRVTGEALITARGLEGGAIYALGPAIRTALDTNGAATLTLDLRRDMTIEALTERLRRPRAKQSTATWLRKTAGLSPAVISLLREASPGALPVEPDELARLIKALPLTITGLAGLERAISTAGGIRADEIDERMMLAKRPGVFVAGEMLDWDAPTGGYLLQACFATGAAAGRGVLEHLGGGADAQIPVDVAASHQS